MLTAAVLVPDTALMVPGAAGAAEVLAHERAAAETAASALLDSERVVVIVPARSGHHTGGGGLADAGIDSSFVTWPAPDRLGPGVATAVALSLLTQVGWTGPVEVVEASGTDREMQTVGERLVRLADRVGLLLLGTVGARREADSPLPPDPRAAAVEDAVLADLAELDRAAVDRLAAVPAGLAEQLSSTVWAGSQVLVGAVRAAGPPSSSTVHRVAPGPVRYAVLSWGW